MTAVDRDLDEQRAPDRPDPRPPEGSPATGSPDVGLPTLPPPEASIETCPDGPLLVRGDVVLLDDDGRPIEKGRRTVALCRCGGSSIKPWCDGTHKVNGFSTTS